MKRFIFLLIITVVFSYCSKDNEPVGNSNQPVYSIEVISGNNQSGSVNTPLNSLVVVKVTDQNADPVPDIELTVEVIAGGGYVMSNLLITEEDGTLGLRWQLGEVGQNEIRISLPNHSDIFVNAVATAVQTKPLTTFKVCELR